MSPKKKIAYFIGSMRRGGTEGQVLHLLRHFSGAGYECVLYLLSETGEHLAAVQELGVKVRGFNFERKHRVIDPRTPVEFWRTIGQIADALKQDQPDIFHCFLYWANVLGVAAARSARVPCVVTSRRSLGLYKDGRRWMQWIEDWTNRHVSAVTVNSAAVREDTLEREKLDPKKIHLIYNGVEFAPPATGASVEAFLSGAGLAEAKRRGAKMILCVANLIHYKGHLTLIDATADLVRRGQDVHLLLVGRDGGMKSKIVERSAQQGLTDRIHFFGSVSPLEPAYAAADLVVHPSNEEGFSNSILEAMAAGRAIVASRVGGIPEAITDGEHGLLVPKGDAAALATALGRLLSDASLREKMGKAARERALAKFSLEAMFHNYESFYDSLSQIKGSD